MEIQNEKLHNLYGSPKLIGRSNEEGWDSWGKCYAWETWETRIKF